MKTLLLPTIGVAAAIGAAQPAAADVLVSQLMIQGQPGYTGNVNRTVTPGTAGITPFNTPVAPSPVAPSASFRPQTPFIGERGDLNVAEPEAAGPAERDASGKLVPSVDRAQARFLGERGPDGKLLPTHSPELRAQATQPTQITPQASPPTPPRSDMQRGPSPQQRQMDQQQMQRQPSGQMRGGTTRTDRSQRSGETMSRRGHREEYTTSALNALSAEGYTNVGRLERVGNMYQTTASREGRQVTVQVDPESGRITER